MSGSPVVEADHLVKHFPIKKGVFGRAHEHVHAVDDVTLSVARGETLGLVGESGCGKSTLCRTLLRLEEPTAGAVRFEGADMTALSQRALRPLRREMQMVFQDPYSSLNPRKRVGQIIGDPLKLFDIKPKDGVRARVQELLSTVGLNPEHYNRYPHEFSGGQRQRVGVARALALQPKLVVADEPVSALDVSIQAQIINLLEELQDEFDLTYVFVAHDLAVVRQVSDRIAVMYLGKVVELSPAAALYEKPIHPYTVSLLSSIPLPDPELNRKRRSIVLEGDVPSPIDPPSGCRFHTRCPHATEICSRVEPPLVEYPGGHKAACHHPLNVSADDIAAAKVAPENPRSAGDELPQPSDASAGSSDSEPLSS